MIAGSNLSWQGIKRKAVYTKGAGPVCKCTGQCTLEGSVGGKSLSKSLDPILLFLPSIYIKLIYCFVSNLTTLPAACLLATLYLKFDVEQRKPARTIYTSFRIVTH